MSRKLTQEEFIARATEVHSGKYDYSKASYVNSQTKACIICPEHGEFWQTPNSHLSGHGCTKCKNESIASMIRCKPKYNSRHIIYGVGINDINGAGSYKDLKSYYIWRQILFRCYSIKGLEKRSSYIGCTVCEDWHRFSNFKKWFDENYVEGWCVDKDILSPKNKKIYSPETCCFIPNEINVLFNRHQKKTVQYRYYGCAVF